MFYLKKILTIKLSWRTVKSTLCWELDTKATEIRWLWTNTNRTNSKTVIRDVKIPRHPLYTAKTRDHCGYNNKHVKNILSRSTLRTTRIIHHSESYWSFKIIVNEQDFNEAIDPTIWPEHACVSFFIPQKEKYSSVHEEIFNQKLMLLNAKDIQIMIYRELNFQLVPGYP